MSPYKKSGRLKKATVKDVFFNIFNTMIMSIIAIVTFYPFIYILMFSLSSRNTFAKILIYPEGFSIGAYKMLLLAQINFLDGLKVSVGRGVLGPIFTLIIVFMGAYALSRKELILRKSLSKFVVFSMYFNTGIIPVYMNISSLKLTSSFWVYIIPGLVNVFSLILIRTYIIELPRSLEESAYIDGANDLMIAFRIVFPLCTPILAAVALFGFVSQWNAYTDTLLYNATEPKLFTLQYILTNFIKGQTPTIGELTSNNIKNTTTFTMESLNMTMTVIICIPIILVYPFLQRYFIKGLLLGAIKE
jgi:putative aldouronate transport system permease protein